MPISTMPKHWEMQRVSRLSHEEQLENMRGSLRRLEDRNSTLEQRVEHLRVSRRVLMTLLEQLEQENAFEVKRLEKLLALERSQKKRVPKDHPLWTVKEHPSLNDLADEHLANYPNDHQVMLEAQGIRENAKSIRAEFKTDETEALAQKQAEIQRIRRLSKQERD